MLHLIDAMDDESWRHGSVEGGEVSNGGALVPGGSSASGVRAGKRDLILAFLVSGCLAIPALEARLAELDSFPAGSAGFRLENSFLNECVFARFDAGVGKGPLYSSRCVWRGGSIGGLFQSTVGFLGRQGFRGFLMSHGLSCRRRQPTIGRVVCRVHIFWRGRGGDTIVNISLAVNVSSTTTGLPPWRYLQNFHWRQIGLVINEFLPFSARQPVSNASRLFPRSPSYSRGLPSFEDTPGPQLAFIRRWVAGLVETEVRRVQDRPCRVDFMNSRQVDVRTWRTGEKTRPPAVGREGRLEHHELLLGLVVDVVRAVVNEDEISNHGPLLREHVSLLLRPLPVVHLRAEEFPGLAQLELQTPDLLLRLPQLNLEPLALHLRGLPASPALLLIQEEREEGVFGCFQENLVAA